MKRITITSIARADAAEAAEYIAGESPDDALRFLESLERSLLEIQTFPYIGREAEFETDLPVRFWFVKHFPNYLIFYTVSQVEVRIARVIHSARDYPSSFTKQED